VPNKRADDSVIDAIGAIGVLQRQDVGLNGQRVTLLDGDADIGSVLLHSVSRRYGWGASPWEHRQPSVEE